MRSKLAASHATAAARGLLAFQVAKPCHTDVQGLHCRLHVTKCGHLRGAFKIVKVDILQQLSSQVLQYSHASHV